MPDYSKGKIYKIQSHVGDKIYIGSTTKQYLSQRLVQHRTRYKIWKNGKTDKTRSFELFEEYGIDNCEIILIENFPCESKDQLNAREAHYIKSLSCVNKIIPLRTTKEYLEDNKLTIAEKKKEYYEKHKEYFINHANEKIDCECGGRYSRCHKSHHFKTTKHQDYIKNNKVIEV